MPLLLTLTIVLPLLGAGGILGLSLVSRLRPYTRYVTPTVVGITTVLILMLGSTEPLVVVPSLWQPSLLFGSALTLRIDVTAQPLVLVLALATWSAALVEISHTDIARPQLASALLALLSAGFAALWSANVLTMALSWAAYDLVQAVATIAAGGSPRMAIRSAVSGSLATLLLWTGAVLSGGGADSELWSLMTPSGASLTLWAAAGMLRLWAYPFHLFAPVDLADAPPLGIPLLLGPVVGWGMWLRIITANEGFMPSDAWVSLLAAGTLALGGLLAWSRETPRRLSTWVGMGANGAVLLVTGLAGENATTMIVAGSISWALGVTVFFLGDGWRQESPWWNVPTLVGLLTLLGMPLTLGFVPAATLLGELMQVGRIAWRGAAFWASVVGYLLLIPSLVRRFLTPPATSLPQRRGMVVARGLGLGLPALVIIAAGLTTPLLIRSDAVPSLGSLFAMPGLVGWSLWAVVLVCGGLLAWQEKVIRSRIGLLLSAIHDVLRLEWLYRSVVGALDRGLGVLRVADEVVGGAGALLWSLLLFLLLLMVWSGL